MAKKLVKALSKPAPKPVHNTGSAAGWRALQKRRARMRHRLNRKNSPKTHQSRRPRYRKRDFLKALKDTGGVLTTIAENLGCQRQTVANLLARPDWADVRERYRHEVESKWDLAEKSLFELIRAAEDESVRANLIKWFLERVKRDQYLIDRRVVLEGGKNPIKTQNANVNVGVDVSTLNLPVDVQRTILQALDAKDGTESFIETPAGQGVVGQLPAIVGDNEEETDQEAEDAEALEEEAVGGDGQTGEADDAA